LRRRRELASKEFSVAGFLSNIIILRSFRVMRETKVSSVYRATEKNEEWVVTVEGFNHPRSTHLDQASAWHETKRLARGAAGEALLQGRDGEIRTRNSYKRDSLILKA
jgi:hypothetical protein